MQELNGTGVALVTPLHQDRTIDLTGLEKLIDYVLDGQVEYLVVMGTTAESPVLTWEEKMTVLNHAISYTKRRVPIVLGLGGNNTTEILQKLPEVDTKELTAILSVSPYYNKPSQEGLLYHYQAIAKQSKLPIVLYNVPGRTGSNIDAATSLQLADHENIVGLKDATADMNQIATIAKAKPDDFSLLSGEDSLVLPAMSLGAEGVISVIANFLPKEFSTMVRLANSGDYTQARKIHHQLLTAMELTGSEGNPTSIKTGLNTLGLMGKTVRLPLTEGSEELSRKYRAELESLNKGE
ncbi:MAG: 4-hydroxy-tetrahydrodipicolinate synthase [Cytophagales bacterium]|nr:4-hydroxy-tetrahydrodipicolinate synthase [Cytophagales bacterium]